MSTRLPLTELFQMLFRRGWRVYGFEKDLAFLYLWTGAEASHEGPTIVVKWDGSIIRHEDCYAGRN